MDVSEWANHVLQWARYENTIGGEKRAALLWKETVLGISHPSLLSAFPTMATAVQRPLKGSRISTFYPVKSLPGLSTLDSAFQLQEFISLTIRSDIHNVSAIVSIPDSRSNAEGGADDSTSAFTDDPDGDRDSRNEFAVDEACWIYEQLRYAVAHASTKLIGTHHISSRRLAQDLSHPLITMLQQECTRATCPEMKAGEWMYLCVAHGNDGAMEVSLVFTSTRDHHL